MPTELASQATTAADYIRSKISNYQQPKVAIICGSGLSGLADQLSESTSIPYEEIPNFPISTAPGHAGKLVFGFMSSKKVPVLAMVGRFHSYEGYTAKVTTFPVRVFSKLNIPTLIATNAAGGLNREYEVGDLCVISDHINMPGLVGQNPLSGPNESDFGERFVPLSDAYDLGLRQGFFKAAKALKLERNIHEGTYVYVSGPTYETRAEVRMLSSFADVVGMSTVPEVIVARHSGMSVLAISLVTNKAVETKVTSGMSDKQEDNSRDGIASHEEVLAAGQAAAEDMQKLIEELIGQL